MYKTFEMLKENNPRWKGNGAGYQSVHQWLVRNHGNPRICEDCGKRGMKMKNGRWNIHQSLKQGKEHGHFIERYHGLCYSCHGKYDLTKEKRENLLRANKMSNELTVLKQLERNKKRSLIAFSKKRDIYGHFTKATT